MRSNCDGVEEEVEEEGMDKEKLGASRPSRLRSNYARAELGLGRDADTGCQQRFVVDFDDNPVVTGPVEGEITHFVNEIDSLHGTFGLERAFDQLLHVGGINSHRESNGVLAGGDIAQSQKPDHKRVGEGKLTTANIGKDTENGVFPRGWIDVDTIAGEPGQNLWFRGHEVEWEPAFGGMQEGNCLAAREIGLCWEGARADPSDFPEPRGLSAMVGGDLWDHSCAHVFVDCG